MREYYDYVKECVLCGVAYDDYEDYEDWVFEVRYNGELYACFEEFLEAEYQDEDYIGYLLGDSLLPMYRADVEKELEQD